MISDIQRQLSTYLVQFPEEADKLASLAVQLDEEGDAILSRDNMRGHITTSMFVLNHERTHGLMILHRHSGLWLQPGGHFEDADSLQVSALREVEEETGVRFVDVLHQIPLDISTHGISGRPAKGETDHFHHDFAYLGVAPQHVSLVPQEEEVGGAEWVPLAELLASHSRMQRLTDKVQKFLSR